MSFILDALRKSETDRQQKGTAEFANVPTSNAQPGTPPWLWVLGILLAVNLVVLVGLLLRPDVAPPPAKSAVATQAETAAAPVTTDFASRIAAAKQNAPAREEPTVAEAERSLEPMRAAAPAKVSVAQPRDTTLPTIHELLADGSLSLPELHVDIHVYSEVAADRFVFINMNKHKEGSRLAEGPAVEEITADGVVLRHNGVAFFLPRD